MSAFTGATVLQAADNLFSQLKLSNETLVSHAHAYVTYRTQQQNLTILAARQSGQPNAARLRAGERVDGQVEDALKTLQEDLKLMKMLIEQVAALPRIHVTSNESHRIDSYLQAHRQDLSRKQALVNIGLSQVVPSTEGMTLEQWLAEMKEPLQQKAAEGQEMDHLASIFDKF